MTNIKTKVILVAYHFTGKNPILNFIKDEKKEQKDTKGFTNIVIPSNEQKADETSIKIDVNLSLI